MSQPDIQVGSYVSPVSPGGMYYRGVGVVVRLDDTGVTVRWRMGKGWAHSTNLRRLRLATAEELAKAQLTTLEGL